LECYGLSEPLRLAGDQENERSYYETLLDAGLAVKISLHNTKGEYFGDAITTSPEVVEAMLRQVLESSEAPRGLPLT